MNSEGRHEPGPQHWWEECWSVDFAAPDATGRGALGGFVPLALYPNQRRAWCWVYVVRADGTVAVRDHDVPMPAGRALLARAEGLWCEQVCETPMEHWSIGVEAFGVRLDDPLDGLRGEIGTRLPVGLDLEWEAAGDAVDTKTEQESGYVQLGLVHGDVLLDDEVLPFDGVGQRTHTWGVRDWWSHRSALLWCAASGDRELDVAVDVDEQHVTPLLHAVIPLPERDGCAPSLTRSLIRAEVAGGAAAYGWQERLQEGPPDLRPS